MFSIITVCYNAQNEIEKTIKSVLEQRDCKYEYIFVDGGSTDNTLKIIKTYKSKFEEKGMKVIVISEKDNGIYDAMNKGANRAQGEWINYLNAGDVYFNEEVLKNISCALEGQEADIVVGEVVYVEGYLGRRYKNEKLENLKKHMIFCHQAIFARRNLLTDRPFDLTYHYSADYDWILWAYLNNHQITTIDVIVAFYDSTGISNRNREKTIQEAAQIRRYYQLIPSNMNICEENHTINAKYKVYKRLCRIKPIAYIIYRMLRNNTQDIFWIGKG